MALSGASVPPRAAYVHVPFCRHRCGYCNFTLIAGRDDLIDSYLSALEIELSWLGEPKAVDTLFLGGGTPSHLAPAQLQRLLSLVTTWFVLSPEAEFSVEMNPIDADPEKCALLARYRVDRVSLGVQSLDSRKLQLLERDHTPADVARAVEQTRTFARSVAIDLIFATPADNAVTWLADLDSALRLEPDHVSTYGLTYEKGTAFWTRRAHGQLRSAAEDDERDQYLAAIARLEAAGFEHYEVSNFARPGHRSRHNQVYWRGGGYYAAGPGAARYVDGWRETNHRSTSTYLKRVQSGQSPVAERERIEGPLAARERLVFGLRMLEGIDRQEFEQQTGYLVEDLAGDAIEKFVRWGALEWDGGRLRLTPDGLLISDSLWPEFLP